MQAVALHFEKVGTLSNAPNYGSTCGFHFFSTGGWVGGWVAPPPPLPGPAEVDILGSLDLPTSWMGGSQNRPSFQWLVTSQRAAWGHMYRVSQTFGSEKARKDPNKGTIGTAEERV